MSTSVRIGLPAPLKTMSLGMLRYDHERQLLREWASNRQVDESLNAKGFIIGTWPSLVRLLIWVQESASSNLVVPTIVYNTTL